MMKACLFVDDCSLSITREEEYDHLEYEIKRELGAVFQFERNVNPASVPPATSLYVVDYGGAGIVGYGGSMPGHFSRALANSIKERPSVLFMVWSSFTVNYYRDFLADDLSAELGHVPDDDELDSLLPPNVILYPAGYDVDAAWDKVRTWFTLTKPDPEQCPELPPPAAVLEPEPDVPDDEPEPLENAVKQEESEVVGPLAEPIGYVRIPVYCSWRPGQTKGSARFKYADCIAEVSDPETQEELGTIGGAMFGFYEISRTAPKDADPKEVGVGWHYHMDPRDIWKEFSPLHDSFRQDTLTQLNAKEQDSGQTSR